VLLHEAGHRINLHALRTPAERAVWGRVSTPNDVHPKTLLGGRAEKMDFDVEVLLGGTFAHLGERRLNHFHNGRYLDAGIGADDGNFLFPPLCRNGLDGVENERSEQGAVFAPAEADEPGAGVGNVKLAEIVFNFLERRYLHLSRNLLNH